MAFCAGWNSACAGHVDPIPAAVSLAKPVCASNSVAILVTKIERVRIVKSEIMAIISASSSFSAMMMGFP